MKGVIKVKKKKEADLGKDSLGPLLLKLALPAILAQIINVLYNMVDRMYIGHIPKVGPSALTGVGVTMPVIMAISAFAALVSMGGAPRASIMLGRGEHPKAEKILGNCTVMLVIMAIILTAVFLIWGEPILMVFGASEATIGYALDYMRIYALGTIFVQLALGLNAFINAQGYAKIGMITVAIGALCNIVLDPIFIFSMSMGVKGAALATIISQGLSAILCLYYIKKKVTFLLPSKSDFVLDSSLYLDLFGQGMAMGLMNSIVSIGTVTLQYAINGFGPLIISAQVAARRIMSFAVLPLTSLAAGVTTFTSQNFGAKQFKRIVAGLKQSCLVSITWSVIACVLLYVASPFLAGFISGSNNAVIIDNASRYLRISSLFYPILGMLFIFRNSLQGLGKKLTPLTSSFIELFGKILFVLLVIPSMRYLGVILCEPLIWIPMTIQLYFALRKHIKRLFVS